MAMISNANKAKSIILKKCHFSTLQVQLPAILGSVSSPNHHFSTSSNQPKIHVHVHKKSSPFETQQAPSSSPNESKQPIKLTRTIPANIQANNDSKSSESSSAYSISDSDHLNNMTEVQKRDYEHSYLPGILLSKATQTPSLLSPEVDMQKNYFALRAFHIEIASVRTSEKGPGLSVGSIGGNSLGLLRMRWWKESLNFLYSDDGDNDKELNQNENESSSDGHSTSSCSSSCSGNHHKKKRSKASAGNVGSNPTIRSLKHVIRSQKLSRSLFETMIDARIEDMQNNENPDDNFDTIQDMVDFYSKTTSSLLLLHLESCGVTLFNEEGMVDKDIEKMKEVVNCIGIGLGLINAVRSINIGQVGIPNDLIEKYKINTNDINDPRSIISNNSEESKIAIQKAVEEMALTAKEYFYHARLHQGVIPSGDAKTSLLSVVSAVRYLEKLESVKYNIFDESLRDLENVQSFPGRLWRLSGMFYLWRAKLTGVF